MAGATRTITLLAVHGGTIYKIASGSGAAVTGGTSVLSATKRPYSAPAFGNLYFVDGTNYVVYNPLTNTAATWTPSAGSLPTNAGATARLITRWAGRVVLSGVSGDDHNWFMSRLGDPLDWDYAPADPSPTDPVAGNNSDAGEVDDLITALIAFNDDELVMGGDHSIWRMTGNPLETGRIDEVSSITGIAWGEAYTRDPSGNIYFAGSRGGIFRMPPRGGFPERISASRIDDRLRDIDLSTHVVTMAWDDLQQGLYVFISPLAGGAATHLYWDSRANAWWLDVFANTNHNPICCHEYDADDPGDRLVMIGGRDGHVYGIDLASELDDATNISSEILFGPIGNGAGAEISIQNIAVTLAVGSGAVTLDVFSDDTAEGAYARAVAGTTDFGPITLAAGRNPNIRPLNSAFAHYIRLKSVDENAWALETITVEATPRYNRKRF